MLPERDPEGNETKHLLKIVPLTNKHVLEIGCGDGRLTWRYAAQTQRAIGIDPDKIRLATAIERCPDVLRARVAFFQGKAETLPFAPGAFDVAILAWSL